MNMLSQPSMDPVMPLPTNDDDPSNAAELEVRNRELQRVNQDLECFVYAIAHDLRAPLRTVRGFCERLRHNLSQPMPESVERDLDGIEEGVDRMLALQSRWLKLAQCTNAELQRQRVDLSAAARLVGDHLHMLEPHRIATVSVASGLTANADPVLVHELLQNLLGNAWKFTQRNEHTAHIEFGAFEEDGELVYFVRDNGIGFNPLDTGRLFRPFQRLHTAERFDGTGVGLAIARRIVERHQGRIWAEGETNAGARFMFTLGPQLAN